MPPRSFRLIRVPLLGAALCFLAAVPRASQAPSASSAPHLERRGAATQLIVDGRPFLMLAGELGNNAATTIEAARPIWPNLEAMHLNTALIALSWAQIEPKEGQFDWTLVDGLLQGARDHHLHIVFLWFGSWKNTWSSYAPDWVKADYTRFPRTRQRNGTPDERLTPLSAANRDADARAFAALMQHLRDVDADTHTVLMMQVENEVGSIPDARDHSSIANDAFGKPVPKALVDYLVAHEDTLAPELRAAWQTSNFRRNGTWEELFGQALTTDEFFMAWHYATYINAVADAGKRAYDIPMFANAALIRTSYVPGQYNSGGPLPQSFDIWRAGAPRLDMLSPDIYFNFKEWTARYDQPGNPLFVPETFGGAAGAPNAFYAIGHETAMGFSPFGIGGAPEPTDVLGPVYDALAQLTPLILEHQASGAGMDAVVVNELTRAQRIRVGDYTLDLTPLAGGGGRGGASSPAGGTPPPFGIFIATGPNEYVMAGRGLGIRFTPETPGPTYVGLGTVQEGRFADGRWVTSRQLAGDDTGQGTALSLRGTPHGPGMMRVTLYRYQ
jgi:beta-galactosidase GanA